MVKTATAKKKVIRDPVAKNFKRMDVAAEQYGISVALLKKLINEGRLSRYKLGAATMIDTVELDKLIVVDAGNHGPEAAPRVSQG